MFKKKQELTLVLANSRIPLYDDEFSVVVLVVLLPIVVAELPKTILSIPGKFNF